MLTQLTSLKST